MLILKLQELELIDGNVENEKTIEHVVFQKAYIKQDGNKLIKLFQEKLEEFNYEDETGDVVHISSLSKEKASAYQDIYYETNDDNEEVTIQIVLTLEKIDIKKSIYKWAYENMSDLTKEHLKNWNSRYSEYTVGQLKFDLEVNHDFSSDFEFIVQELNLPESYELSDEQQNYFVNLFVKSAVKNFKR